MMMSLMVSLPVKSLENKFVGYKIDFTDNVMTDEERNIDE